MSLADSYNFRQLSPTLSTSGIVSPTELTLLARQGYHALINLLPDSNEKAVPNEQAIVEQQGLRYIHIPVDFKNPQQSDFTKFATALDALDTQHVHIHCAANYRVSAFYALYAMQRGLWGEAQADAFIHSIWNPQDYLPWPAFIASIKNQQ